MSYYYGITLTWAVYEGLYPYIDELLSNSKPMMPVLWWFDKTKSGTGGVKYHYNTASKQAWSMPPNFHVNFPHVPIRRIVFKNCKVRSDYIMQETDQYYERNLLGNASGKGYHIHDMKSSNGTNWCVFRFDKEKLVLPTNTQVSDKNDNKVTSSYKWKCTVNGTTKTYAPGYEYKVSGDITFTLQVP